MARSSRKPINSAATLALPFVASAAPADAAYEKAPASADGIGKRYMGREIAQVMGWQGAAWLEREEREREERTDLLLPELALKPGMVVADIGAGTGYIARRMAVQVGPVFLFIRLAIINFAALIIASPSTHSAE